MVNIIYASTTGGLKSDKSIVINLSNLLTLPFGEFYVEFLELDFFNWSDELLLGFGDTLGRSSLFWFVYQQFFLAKSDQSKKSTSFQHNSSSRVVICDSRLPFGLQAVFQSPFHLVNGSPKAESQFLLDELLWFAPFLICKYKNRNRKK